MLVKFLPFWCSGAHEYVGPVAASAYDELLGGADALLQPRGDVEVQRLSALEALACGTSVVTFAREAMADIVCHGKTGYKDSDIRNIFGVKSIGRWCREKP